MYISNSLESPAADLTSAGPLAPLPTGHQYVTSPKVMEINEPDTERRIALGWLGLIVACGLVLRLLMFALGPASAAERAVTDTTPLHMQLAASLVTEQAFAYDPQRPITTPGAREQLIELRRSAGQLESSIGGAADGLQPEVWHLPGYALLLGLVDAAGGPTSWLLLGQCALAALASVLVFGIMKQTLDKYTPALIAAALVALHPALVISPLSLSDDVLFITLLLLGVWGAAKRTTPMALLAGAAIGCAVLVRPISIFVGPALALWMILGDRRANTLGYAMTFLVMSLAGPAMWMGRNIMIDFGPRLSAASSVQLATTATKVDARAAGLELPAADGLPGVLVTGSGDLLQAMDRSSFAALKQSPAPLGEVLSLSAWHLMTDHRVAELYRVMGLTYHAGGVADAFATGKVIMPPAAKGEPAERYIALGWLIFNGLILLGTLLGLATMAGRRQGTLLLLVFTGLAYGSWLASGAGVAAWQPVAVVFAAMACGALFARSPRPLKLKKEKKPKKNKKQKRDDTVFDLDDEHIEADPAAREGLASRPI